LSYLPLQLVFPVTNKNVDNVDSRMGQTLTGSFAGPAACLGGQQVEIFSIYYFSLTVRQK
jgi:hypothetical protein